jgi:hypothetical protein
MKLVIKCPKTGVMIDTGVGVGSPQDLANMTLVGNTVQCSAYGQTHVWNKADAQAV